MQHRSKYQVLRISGWTLLTLVSISTFLFPGHVADTFHPQHLSAKTEWVAFRYSTVTAGHGSVYRVMAALSAGNAANTEAVYPDVAFIKIRNSLTRVLLAVTNGDTGIADLPRRFLPRNNFFVGSEDDSSHLIAD